MKVRGDVVEQEPEKKRANLRLARVPLSNKQRKLQEKNRALFESFYKNNSEEDPFLLSELILRRIIDEGYPVEEIASEFSHRISQYRK